MGRILGNWRVVAAAAFSVVLVGGAYVLARGFESPKTAQASTETALLQAIATKDSDNDGLPDWEEALYGTDPNNPDTNHLGMTDGEAVAKGLIVPKAVADVPSAATSTAGGAVSGAPTGATPGSLTDVFAKNFFTLYVAAKRAAGGASLTQDQISSITNQALAGVTSTVVAAPDFKSRTDLPVSGSGPDALRTYAANAEGVFAAHSPHLPKSELLYLQDAIQNNDATAIAHISEIASAYRDIATGLAAVSVPQELAQADLSLINAAARISEAAADFARVKSDPVAAMLALEQYPLAVQTFAQAFQGIAQTFASGNVIIPAGTPGAAFVGLYASLLASSTTP